MIDSRDGMHGDVQLVGRLLDQQLVAARLRRRLEDAVRLVAQSFVAAEEADEVIDAVVVRLDVVVADRPVVAEAVEALAPEVVGAEAQRDAAPVIRAAAEHAGAPPVELLAAAHGVRLAVDVPAADAGVELAERAAARGGAAPRRGPRGHEHLRVLRRVPLAARLEHDDVRAGLGEHVGGHAAARARADDADVVVGALFDRVHQ